MKKLTKKSVTVLTVILSALMLISVFIGIGVSRSKLVNAQVENSELRSEYLLGESLKPLPANIKIGETTVEATHTSLLYPNGRAFVQAEYSLNQAGEYILTFFGKLNDKNVSATYSFKVGGELYSTTGVNSSAEYGLDGLGGKNGVIVSLGSGEVFSYNKPIDLNSLSRYDRLVGLYVTPKSLGKADVRALKIRLTDVCDSTNYVEVATFANRWDENESRSQALYSAAGASNGQTLTGLHFHYEEAAGDVRYTDGQLYQVYDDVSYDMDRGYPSYAFSFAGKGGYGAKPYELYFDYAERQLFGCKTFAEPSNGMIVDLDEPLFFTELWDGFETGYAYLSIYAENYVGNDFRFVLTELAGEDLTKNLYNDDTPPMITINYPYGNSSEIPDAALGVPYKIYTATAYDMVSGATQCEAFVYYGYSSAKTAMEIKDGAFTPKEAGKYYIVYQATDENGNLAEVSIEIKAEAKPNLDLTVPTVAGTLYTGREIEISAPTVLNAVGRSTVSVRAENAKAQYDLVAKGNKFVFTPLYAGDYKLIFTANDYIRSCAKETTVNITANAQPILKEAPVLPTAFIKNAVYNIPSVTGIRLSGGEPIETNATISYANNGSSFTVLSGNALKVEAEGKIVLRYTVDDESFDFVRPVVNAEYEQGAPFAGAYFFGTFANAADDKGVTLTTSAPYASSEYLIPVLVTDFEMSFKIEKLNSIVAFALIDVNDQNNAFAVSIDESENGYGLVTVNGGKTYTVPKSLEGQELIFNYQNGQGNFTIGETVFSCGGFSGIDGHVAKLSVISFDGQGETVVRIKNINRQDINNIKGDFAPPVYSFDINSGNKKIGDEIVISRFTAQDVLSLNSVIKLTVTSPSGAVCKDVTGREMKDVSDFSSEYKISVTEYGVYVISGTITDDFGNQGVFTVTVKSVDDVPPVLELGEKIETGKVGEIVKLAACVASDARDGNIEKVSVCVMDSFHKVVSVSGAEFTPTVAGVYTVMYGVSDLDGNVGFASYEITVS